MKVQRHLPPTAAPLSPIDILAGVIGLVWPGRFRTRLESEIKDYFAVKHVFFLTSGKAALTIILKGLQAGSSRRKVIIPAYTCFSVPSAIIKAGMEVILCDVDPHTLDFDFAELRALVDQDILAIVVPHLLGQPANIEYTKAIGRSVGAYIIEDAAQAMGSKYRGQWLGTQGDIGFYSLGRGKNISAGSGGVIVTNSDHIAEAVWKACLMLPVEPILSSIKNLLTVAVTMLLLNPRMYWLPAGLPWLRLGETHFYHEFPIFRMDGGRAGLLWSWRKRLEESNKHRDENTRNIERCLSSLRYPQQPEWSTESIYLRYPLLMPSADQKLELCKIAKQQGLGASPLYPYPINEIPELKGAFLKSQCLGARRLAECLVTLPTHQLTQQHDLDRIIEAVWRQMDHSAALRNPIHEAVSIR